MGQGQRGRLEARQLAVVSRVGGEAGAPGPQHLRVRAVGAGAQPRGGVRTTDPSSTIVSPDFGNIWENCQTPDQTKIKIQSNQKSGEALYLGSCLLFVRWRNTGRNAGYNRLIPF